MISKLKAWIAGIVAKEELKELDKWRYAVKSHHRFFSEHEDIRLVLDNIQDQVNGQTCASPITIERNIRLKRLNEKKTLRESAIREGMERGDAYIRGALV